MRKFVQGTLLVALLLLTGCESEGWVDNPQCQEVKVVEYQLPQYIDIREEAYLYAVEWENNPEMSALTTEFWATPTLLDYIEVTVFDKFGCLVQRAVFFYEE